MANEVNFLFAVNVEMQVYLHNSSMMAICCGNNADSEEALASSKSVKSKPGATVQPTKQK